MGTKPHISIKRDRSTSGLTLVEVMVGMMVSALFFSTTLQAYIAAVSLRAKSQQTFAAIASIQADAEAIHRMAQVQPQSASECQLSPSSSYVQQLIGQIMAKDTATLNNFPSRSPDWGVGAIEQQQQTLQQSTTLPVATLPAEYQLHRTLSVDLSGLATTTETLQVSYAVSRQQNEIAPTTTDFHTSSSIAQFHTSVMPNAALVCPS